MAKKSLSGSTFVQGKPKRTSIGDGRRKRGSFKVRSQKKYRGQGK
jgi:hypothetical protein